VRYELHRRALVRRRTVAQAVSRRPLTAEVRVRSQFGPCGTYCGQGGVGTDFLPVLQFSPVSIVPPLLHTHSSIYHPHCIMFFSQYFSFPPSVSFHHCSILIFLYIFLPARQSTQEPSKKQGYFVNRGAWNRKYLRFSFFLAVCCPPLTAEAWLPIAGQDLWCLASFPECSILIFILILTHSIQHSPS
jgi:hypothetical protein